MRVAILSWRDTTHPEGGGAEVFVERVAEELVKRGHEVTIRCAAHANSPAQEIRQGVRFSRAGGRLTVYPRALLWLIGPGRRQDAVIDVVNGLPFAAPLVRRRALTALVHHVHREQWHIIYPGWPGRVGWFVESRVVPRLYRGHNFLTVSEASRGDLVGLGIQPAAITVARNGLDLSSVDAPKSKTPRLVVCARLVPHKRIEHAFEVVARLREAIPELTLDVVGDGWWRDRLEDEARSRGVADAVKFHGHVDESERDRLLASAWLHLLPSVKEGWGLSIMESAGQGTPSVAYRSAGGVNEAICDGETGRLVDDLDEMCEATGLLLQDNAERARLGSMAAERARSFTWAATTDQVEQLISGRRK